MGADRTKWIMEILDNSDCSRGSDPCGEGPTNQQCRGIMKYLREDGVDLMVCSERGTTIGHMAAKQGKPEILDSWLRAGGEVNGVDRWQKNTIGHCASAECLRIWLKSGGAPNLLNHEGNTIGTLAVGFGDANSLRIWLNGGGDLTVGNGNLDELDDFYLSGRHPDRSEYTDLVETAISKPGSDPIWRLVRAYRAVVAGKATNPDDLAVLADPEMMAFAKKITDTCPADALLPWLAVISQ